MAKKPSMGRQKIKIAKIEIKNHLQVTFSKRRSGLFKKASELCTLCGVDVAVVVFSPAGKVFSFGHPGVENIVDRFLSQNPRLPAPPNTSSTCHLMEAHRSAAVRELNSQLTRVLAELEAERKRGETLDHVRRSSRGKQEWWEKPVEDLGLAQLERLRESMEGLKRMVTQQLNKALVEGTLNTSPFLLVNNGNRTVDLWETKPSQIIGACSSATLQGHNFGFGHGFF
ncbi:hypothetical protein NMG60_11021300 [Bertholletia excelsa]